MAQSECGPAWPAPPAAIPGAAGAQPQAPATRPVSVRAGHYRWTICALLFFATTINYMDRQVIGILAPDLQHIFGWNEIQYGFIITAFQAAYALGLLAFGGIIDRLGERVGYALAIAIWSLSAMAHALANSVFGFGLARFMLGLGESGNFPAGVKTVAEWFPRQERALATGIFNAGTNVGAILAPLAVPWIVLHWGWRYGFVFTGLFSAIWLAIWLKIYRRPRQKPGLSPAELAYIETDAPDPPGRITWAKLLPHRQTWAFLIAKFLTDPIWWFFLFWLPKFLHATRGLTLGQLGPPLVAIYCMADAGSVAGGWLPCLLLKRGWRVHRARQLSMLVCAIAVTPIVFAAKASRLWEAVALVGLAVAAHQGFSANLFTLPSDMFPRRAVASVVGIGGFGGAIGGMLIATFTGYLLQWTGSYLPVFCIAATAYLLALGCIHLLAPRLEPATLQSGGEA